MVYYTLARDSRELQPTARNLLIIFYYTLARDSRELQQTVKPGLPME